MLFSVTTRNVLCRALSPCVLAVPSPSMPASNRPPLHGPRGRCGALPPACCFVHVACPLRPFRWGVGGLAHSSCVAWRRGGVASSGASLAAEPKPSCGRTSLGPSLGRTEPKFWPNRTQLRLNRAQPRSSQAQTWPRHSLDLLEPSSNFLEPLPSSVEPCLSWVEPNLMLVEPTSSLGETSPLSRLKRAQFWSIRVQV